MGRKKILLVMYNINYAGAAKMFSFLANGLSEINNDIHVYTYAGSKPHYNLNSCIVYHPENKISNNLFMKRISPLFGIKKAIKKIQPDVVVSFLPNANVYSILASLSNRLPIIIAERSDPYSERGFLLSFKRYFYKYANGAVFQTEGAKSYYCESLQKRSTIIPNPVIIEKIKGNLMGGKNNEISFVGRFDIKQKRQDIMLKAFKRVSDTDKKIKLVFYGEGSDMPQVKQMVKDLGLSERVIFRGMINDVTSSIRNSKMFVLTSDYEGIPNALVEAMALGLPVVSTDCSPGGARLLIENKKNGLIVNTGDVNSIANAILFLLDNPETAEQFGKEAQKIINKYSPKKIIKMWDEYIEWVISISRKQNYPKCNR